MIPAVNADLDLKEEQQPSRTFSLDSGTIDGLEAVKQAIYLILNTERYKHLIYSWDYGVELDDLIGREKEYAYPELKRRITEALVQDDRILEVSDFDFKNIGGKVTVSFSVNTVFGHLSIEKEVIV